MNNHVDLPKLGYVEVLVKTPRSFSHVDHNLRFREIIELASAWPWIEIFHLKLSTPFSILF